MLIVAFRAEVTALIQLYIVGVFVSFTLSQIGMVRHWTRLLRTETDPAARRRMLRSRVDQHGRAASCTGTVLVIVLVTKFLPARGSRSWRWRCCSCIMKAIHRHYDRGRRANCAPPRPSDDIVLPSRDPRDRAGVQAAQADPAGAGLRAGDPARHAGGDHRQRRRRRDPGAGREWEDADIPVPLKVIASPYREITRPVIDYVKRISRDSPRDVVTVFIPEYVVGHWWEQVLHNQSALRLKGRLLFSPASW